MATKVTLSAGAGKGTVADIEVSGGRTDKLYPGESQTFELGAQGGYVQMLTIERPKGSRGSIKVSTPGKVVIDEGPKTIKKLSKGSFVLPASDRFTVRESA